MKLNTFNKMEEPTPLHQLGENLYAKLEWQNPAGSSKYRPARNMIVQALEAGLLKPGQTVVESSSGNLGLALAHVCHEAGLGFHCVVDPNTPPYTLESLRQSGAEITRVHRPDPVSGSFLDARRSTARNIFRQDPDRYFWPDQYSNPNNPWAQMETIKELQQQLGRLPDLLICAVGSWGTAVGCTLSLRRLGSNCRVLAVDGQDRLDLCVPGLSYGRRPSFEVLPGDQLPPLHAVETSRALQGCRRLWHDHRLDVGGSSGAVWSAYHDLELDPKERVVLLFADDGSKYRHLVWGAGDIGRLAS